MFVRHGIMPSVIYKASEGERILCNAMIEIENESISKSKEDGDKYGTG